MPQWDVYENPSPRMRDVLPYVVVLQSDLLAGLNTRLIAPLAAVSQPPPSLPLRMCPMLDVNGTRFMLIPQEAAPIDARALRKSVATLRDQAHRIVDALDAAISGV